MKITPAPGQFVPFNILVESLDELHILWKAVGSIDVYNAKKAGSTELGDPRGTIYRLLSDKRRSLGFEGDVN